MLRVLVFVCGAALMALEILGARVLAPVLGNSIFVWGALISSFMVAMSVGYWLGGLISDRAAHLGVLGLAAAAGGLLAVVVPAVSAAILPRAATLGPRLGPLTASVTVFFLPTLALSLVSPIAVHVGRRETEGVGRTAGGLYALSTAGSIAGSLGTAFWLIPLAPVDSLVVGTGLVLIAVGTTATFAPVVRTAEGPAPSAAWSVAVGGIAVVGLVLGIASLGGKPADVSALPAGEKVVFRKDTQYHRITVTDRDNVRSLRFDNRRQSAVDLRDGYTSDIRYTDYLHLAMAVKPEAKRVLVLGLGGGALPKRMWHDYPGVRIDSVEIDPVVADVARRYFDLPDDPRLKVYVGDGRQYVTTTREHYDVVVVDAYYADSMPFHMATEEFFRQVRAVLTPGGVVAYNVISSVEGDRSKLFRSMYKTAGDVFGSEFVFPIGLASERNPAMPRNIVMLSTDSPLSAEALRERVASRVGGRVTIPHFESFAEDLYTEAVPTSDVPVLTDRYAPVDSLIHLD